MWNAILLQALKSDLCVTRMRPKALHRSKRVLQIRANTIQQDIVTLDFLGQERIEGLVFLQRDGIFV